MIINLNNFLVKKDWITSILLFTFASMKKDKKQESHSSNRAQNNKSFLSILKRFYSIKGNFTFDLFQFLKMEHLELQIIYANIRV